MSSKVSKKRELIRLLQECVAHLEQEEEDRDTSLVSSSSIVHLTMAALHDYTLLNIQSLKQEVLNLEKQRNEQSKKLLEERKRLEQMQQAASPLTPSPNGYSPATASPALSDGTQSSTNESLNRLTQLELQKKAAMEKRRQEVIEQRRKAAAEQKKKEQEQKRKFMEYEQRKQALKEQAAKEAAEQKKRAQEQAAETDRLAKVKAAATASISNSTMRPKSSPAVSPIINPQPTTGNNSSGQRSNKSQETPTSTTGESNGAHPNSADSSQSSFPVTPPQLGVPHLPSRPPPKAASRASPASQESTTQPVSSASAPTGSDLKYQKMMSQASAAQEPNPATSSPTDLSEEQVLAITSSVRRNILLHWGLVPPTYQVLRPIDELVSTIQNVYPPAFGVVDHPYFRGWKPILSNELNEIDSCNLLSLPTLNGEKLKKAVRKLRFFLHPDKLPKDLDPVQEFVCKLLWDITSDAYEDYKALVQ